jgi:plastocyanin
MRTGAPVVVLVVGLFALSCSQQRGIAPSPVAGPGSSASATAQSGVTSVTTAAAAALPLTAEIQFGRADVGSGYPPPSGHDASFHANDKLFPRTVVIGAGGTVTFTTFGVHEIALYAAGTSPDDIDTSLTIIRGGGCPPVPFINDPTNRIAVWAPQCDGGPAVVTHPFPSAGKYLAICDFLPHFVDANMYGWIDVK